MALISLWKESKGIQPVADLGGGGHSRLVPPLLKHFSINAPPLFCTCAPLLKPKKKKKKKVSDSTRLYPGCYLPPPPPPPPDVDGAPEKKVSESPPPPPAYQLFWDLRGKKNSMLCPPFLKFLDPPLNTTMNLKVKYIKIFKWNLKTMLLGQFSLKYLNVNLHL